MNKAMTDKIRNKSKTILFVFLAILLVLATWYKLKIQGITMTEDVFYEEVLICDNTEENHVHSEECYEKVAVTSSDKQKKANQIKENVQNTTDSELEEQQVQNTTEPNSKEQQDKTEQKQDLEQSNETNSQENTLEDMEQKEISKDTNSNNIMIDQNTFSLDATLARRCTITIISADGKISTKQVRQGGTYTLGSNLKWKIGDSSDFTAGGTQITVNEDITIEESKEITINYTVDTSTDATGLDEKYKYDGIAIPTVQGTDKYTTVITYNNGTTTENLSDKYVTPYDSTATISKDRVVLEFIGWKVNNSSTIVNSQTEIDWDTLYNYAQNGEINLKTSWKKIDNKRKYVNFYIRYDSVAVDIDGNVTSQDTNMYTPSLWASYVGNENLASDIADTTSDNSFTANKKIRELEGVKENSAYVYNMPTDEYVLSQLKKYSSNLSIDGEKVSVDKLDLEHYEIRWYVFKIQNNFWHIDGKLVRKEGKMAVTKTFTGSKSAIEAVINSNYYLEMKGGDTTTTTTNLYLNTANLEDKTTEQTYELKYTWVVDVKYGINYTITERNYNVDKFITNTVYNIVDPENTKYKKVYNADGTYYYETDTDGNFITTYVNQSKGSTTSDTAYVIGVNNYAIDSSETIDNSKLINVNFTNTYVPTSAITIKKDDSITNNGLANAQFSLYEVTNNSIDENSPIKFTYNE